MTEYDLAQREQLRQTLLAYMKEHKIGVPRLAQRVKETVHRNPEIPVKTLQRFLKGEVRTIDMHVGFLAQFVEKASNVDPTPRLGSALAAFYSSQDKTDWSGLFHVSEGQSESVEGSSTIEIVRDQGAWRVKETTANASPRRIYDGALTTSGKAVLMVLKERLTGLPRTITVGAINVAPWAYAGVTATAHYTRDMPFGYSPLRPSTRWSSIAMRK
jgi:hypothetical protein